MIVYPRFAGTLNHSTADNSFSFSVPEENQSPIPKRRSVEVGDNVDDQDDDIPEIEVTRKKNIAGHVAFAKKLRIPFGLKVLVMSKGFNIKQPFAKYSGQSRGKQNSKSDMIKEKQYVKNGSPYQRSV